MSRLLNHRFVKFVSAGVIAATVEYASFLLLVSTTNTSVQKAQVLSFFVGLLISFALNKQWVFGDTAKGSSVATQFLLYGCLAGFNAIFSYYAIGFMHNNLGITPAVAKLLVMTLIVSWNYFLFKNIIFIGKNRT